MLSMCRSIQMSVLEPEQIRAMRSAFKKVSDALKLDYRPNDPMTDVIVSRITECVNDGEIDPDRICDLVLMEIASVPA
jgi:hypothetical protein